MASCVLKGPARFVLMIALVGAVTKYVPLHPPRSGGSQKVSSAAWTLDIKELAKAITPKTKMIVCLFQIPALLVANNKCRLLIRRNRHSHGRIADARLTLM
jgi:hypothetical protein